MKIPRNPWLLITLVVIPAVVFLFVVWIVWPEPPPKELTLHLKFVRNEVIGGKTNLVFRVEGADKYQIFIRGYTYVQPNEPPLPANSVAFDSHTLSPLTREIRVDDLSDLDITNQTWQIQAHVWVLMPDDELTKISDVIKDTWRERKRWKPSIFVEAKFYWSYPHNHVISDQIISSDFLITNTPSH